MGASCCCTSTPNRRALSRGSNDATSAPAESKQNGPSRLEVKGAEEAEAGGELRNPFSMLHETREQMAAAPAPLKEKQPQAAGTPDAAKAADSPKNALPKAPSRASVANTQGYPWPV